MHAGTLGAALIDAGRRRSTVLSTRSQDAHRRISPAADHSRDWRMPLVSSASLQGPVARMAAGGRLPALRSAGAAGSARPLTRNVGHAPPV
jgi:hypothetical protein